MSDPIFVRGVAYIPGRHQGLVRGTSHLQVCASGHTDCKDSAPQLVRYDGYKHLQEPESQIISCSGPRGVPINESDEDAIWAYPGVPDGKINAPTRLEHFL